MSSEAKKLYNRMAQDVMSSYFLAGVPPEWTVAEPTIAPRGSPNWPSELWSLKRGDWKAVTRQWHHLEEYLLV